MAYFYSGAWPTFNSELTLLIKRPDLLAARVGWQRLLPALRDTSGERFTVLGPASAPWTWLDSGKAGDAWPLLAGDHQGCAYVLAQAIGVGATADRVTALAGQLGALVLGYSFEDTTASEQLTVARGRELLRYTVHSNWGDHEEGTPLPGEADGIDGLLHAFGFDPDGWLQQGTVRRVAWTPLEPGSDAHRRLYLGPLRLRIDHIEQAALQELEEGPLWSTDTE